MFSRFLNEIRLASSESHSDSQDRSDRIDPADHGKFSHPLALEPMRQRFSHFGRLTTATVTSLSDNRTRRHHFEHDQCYRGKRRRLKRRASRQRGYAETGKPGGVNNINCFEIFDIREQESDLDDILWRAS